MSLLFENPWPILVTGVLLTVILTSGFLRTGRITLIWATVGVMGLTVTLFFLERRIVTPMEEVEMTLHQIAAELEANNIEGVVGYIASSAPQLEKIARSRLRDVTIEQVKIKRNLHIELASRREPNLATARFNVVVVGADKAGTLGRRQGAWFFVVNFRKEQGGWRVESFEEKDPRAGLRRPSG